jgi:hypothetical protein
MHLIQESPHVGYVLQYIARKHHIECPIVEWKTCSNNYNATMEQRVLAYAGVKVSTYNFTTWYHLGLEIIPELEACPCTKVQHNQTWLDTGLDPSEKNAIIIPLIRRVELPSEIVTSTHW